MSKLIEKAADPETLAMDLMLKLVELIEKHAGGRCRSFSRRASELPQIILQTGLTPATLFYMSKIESEPLLNELVNVVTGRTTDQQSKEIKTKLVDECGGEGKGYTLGLVTIYYALVTMSRMGMLLEASEECRKVLEGERHAGIAMLKCLKIVREQGVEMYVENMLQPYLIAIKRMAEALYKERKSS